MKKKMLLLAAIALMGCGVASAQDDSANGKWAIETEVIPNAVGADWFVPNLTLGYFLNNGDQVYASFEINTNRVKGRNDLIVPIREDYVTDAAFETAQDVYNHKINEYGKGAWGDFTLGLGYQHYLIKDGRFRPFINGGIDFVFNWARMSNHEENFDAVANEWYTVDQTIKGYLTDGVNSYYRGFGFQIEAGLGFDFYLYQGLYIGAELGVSYDMYWDKDYTEHVVTTQSAVPEDMRDLTYTTDVKGFYSEGYQWVTPMIRIGWRF